MATASRTNQTQRPSPARAADHENLATINDLPAGKAVTLVVERIPFPIAIEPLQKHVLIHVGEFDGSK